MRRRRSQDENLSHFYIHNWKTFREVWKSTQFSKKFNEISQEQLRKMMIEKCKELLDDEKYLCYMFPDSLKEEHALIIIDLVRQDLTLKDQLDYEYEALFFGQKKQLLVYRSNFRSLSSYLSKYRLPTQHKQLLDGTTKACQIFQSKIISRNILISLRKSKQEIQKATEQLKKAQVEIWKPQLQKYSNFMTQVIKDFNRQQKKYQIMIDQVKLSIRNQLDNICKDYPEIRVSDRYYEEQSHIDTKDILILKESNDEGSQCSFDQSFHDDEDPIEGLMPKIKQTKFTKPKSLQQVHVKQFKKEGIICLASLKKWGLSNRPTHIKATIKYPKCYQNYQSLFIIPNDENDTLFIKNQDSMSIQILLEPLNYGYTQYSIRAINDYGESFENVVKVWVQKQNEKQAKQGECSYISVENNMLHVLGNSENGVIINSQSAQQNSEIILSTNKKWEKIPIACVDFSVSNHAVICNSYGDVAGWGKMFCVTEETDEKSLPEELNQDNQTLPFIKPYSLRIEKLSLIMNNNRIRKVSCGQSYCLLANKFGKVWSFGLNNFGQLGLGHCDQTIDTSEPIQILSLANVFITDVIATDNSSSFAIDAKGVGYRWGLNQIQQSPKPILDSYKNIINYEYDNVIISQSTPLKIRSNMIDDPIIKMGGGKDFSLALTKNNKLYGWGNTQFLGQQKIQNSHFQPISKICNPILIMKNVKNFSVGDSHCLALTENNEIIAWGQSAFYRNSLNNQISKKMQKIPIKIIDQFKGGYFECGQRFTVIETQLGIIKFFGDHEFANQKQGFKLPTNSKKIQVGDDVVMVMSK